MVQKWISILFLCVVSISPGLMQEATDSPSSGATGVIVYQVNTGTLAALTEEGFETLANLPAVVEFTGPEFKTSSSTFVLSPDHSKLAIALTEQPGIQPRYSIADVATGGCCLTLDPQDPYMNTLAPHGVAFSPDGKQLAVSYLNYFNEMPPRIAVFDATTGQVVGLLRSKNVLAQDSQEIFLLHIYHWTADGIGVYGSTCCHPLNEGFMQYWIPGEEFIGPPDFYFNIKDDTLITGESVRVDVDREYAIDESDGVYIPQNVVMHYLPPQMPEVIYFNSDNLVLQSANWVADGHAILIRHGDKDMWDTPGEAFALLRDGTQIPVALEESEYFVAGTVDGWITQDSDAKTFTAYHLNGSTVEASSPMSYTGTAVVVDKPVLGASLQEPPMFPLVAP